MVCIMRRLCRGFSIAHFHLCVPSPLRQRIHNNDRTVDRYLASRIRHSRCIRNLRPKFQRGPETAMKPKIVTKKRMNERVPAMHAA
jgi:hypothetical protein